MSNDHAARRAQLEEEREQLSRRIDELTVGGEFAPPAYDDDFADRGQVAGELGANKVLADSMQNQLDLVEKALGRLDDGSYGTCEVCGETIGAERLEVMPATARCINHA